MEWTTASIFFYAIKQEKRAQEMHKNMTIKSRPKGGGGALRCRRKRRKLWRPRWNFGNKLVHRSVLEVGDD
jgi:hypothetical protein